MPFTARDSFKWMCFKKVYFSSCVSVRGIAIKSTSRLASDHGGQSLLRRAMSSMFSKYPSLLFEILLRNVQQHLQSGQLHPLPTSNGAEITTLLFVGLHSSQVISNLYRGIIQPFRGIVQPFPGIVQPFPGIIQPFQGIIQPFRGSTHPMRRITCTCMQNTVCCQRTTQSIPPRLHERSSYRVLTLLVEWKQKTLFNEIMTMENTSTEAMPGQYVTYSTFSANGRSGRQSFRCLHLNKAR